MVDVRTNYYICLMYFYHMKRKPSNGCGAREIFSQGKVAGKIFSYTSEHVGGGGV